MMSIKEVIGRLDFFSHLEEEQVTQLTAISSLKKYNAERLLHYEKTQSNTLLFLVEGLAKAYKIDKHDNEIFLYYLYANEMLSEVTTLQSDTLLSYSNIVFLEESQVLSVEYEPFKREFLEKGLLCLELANETIRQSKQLQDLVNREFIFDSVSKVAKMLHADVAMFNRLKRYDVSLMLHIQPSTLSRVLSRLKRQAIIDIERGEVIIVNAKALERIYEGVALWSE